MVNNNLKAINIIHFDGKSINLNDVCMSHTVFPKGQIFVSLSLWRYDSNNTSIILHSFLSECSK